MRAALMVLALLAEPAGARDVLGVYRSWGAFRDADPPRCFAVARPVTGGGRVGGFASVADWPRRGLRGSLHLRLSRPRGPTSAVTLSIGERRWTLAADTQDAWATDAPSDRAIAAAMRGSRSMSVEWVGATGRPFADVYALDGAATAIDAAALGCLR